MKNKNSFTLRKVLRLARKTGARDISAAHGGVSEDLLLPFYADDMNVTDVKVVTSDGVSPPRARAKINKRRGARREYRKLRERRYYGSQLTALYAMCAISVWQWGKYVAVLLLAGLLSAVLTDYICCRLSGKTYSARDKSTLCAGLCTGLMLPWNISPGIAVLGAAIAISVKHIFGGRRAYIFSPTAVAVCFLIICYPASMLLYAPPAPDAPSVAVTEYLTHAGQTAPEQSAVLVTDAARMPTGVMGYLTGQFLGAAGTVHLFIILVCGVVLLLRRSVSFSATAGIVLSSLAVTELFRFVVSDISFAVRYLVPGAAGSPGGGYLGGPFTGAAGAYFPFVIVFLLSDPQILPKSRLGRAYYGVFAGIFEAAFFYFGKTGAAVLFALLIADIFALQCDRYAAYTRKFAAKLSVMLHRRVHSFEHVREVSARFENYPTALASERPGETALPLSAALPDITRELDLELLNYDMPPIHGKVTKVVRKKYVLSHFVSKTVKKMRRAFLRERGNPKSAAAVRHNHIGVIMPYMRDGLYVAHARVLSLLRVKPKLTPIEAAAEEMLKAEMLKAEMLKAETLKAETQKTDTQKTETLKDEKKPKTDIKEKFLDGINKLKKFVSEKLSRSRLKNRDKTQLRTGGAAKELKEEKRASRVTRKVRRRVPKSKDRRKSRTRGKNAHKGRKHKKE